MTKKITYAQIHRLLGDLGFVEFRTKKPAKPAIIFEHKASDFRLFFGPHRASKEVDAMDLSVVRKMLDETGLLERDEFEDALRESSANSVAKGKPK